MIETKEPTTKALVFELFWSLVRLLAMITAGYCFIRGFVVEDHMEGIRYLAMGGLTFWVLER